MQKEYLTVSEINSYLNNKLKSDFKLKSVKVIGEISRFTTVRGHSYFGLKDKTSQIECMMFASDKYHLKFEPKPGMEVLIEGRIELFERDGKLQLYATNIEEIGTGKLYKEYLELKNKLEKEGLFDEMHKKDIPRYPNRIGVVTAKTGAAIKDIITTVKRRYPSCEIFLFSTLVQGDRAAQNIVEQIKHAQEFELDTLIVGRGGGSIEDLWSFNEEIVAREIYASEIPIISAVGHERDYTISDFVADVRAATPTAAAELAVPDSQDLKSKINQFNTRLTNSITDKYEQNRYKLDQITKKPMFKNPQSLYDVKNMQLDKLISKFHLVSKNILNNSKNNLFELENSAVLKNPDLIIKTKKEEYIRNLGKLEVLNPLLTLKRGYTIAKVDDKVVTSVNDVKKDDELEVVFEDGSVKTRVI